MYNLLRRLRIVLSLGFFFLILFCFINVHHVAGRWWELPLGWQLIPAILAGSFAVVIILLLLTLLFGRIYCSTLCPLGTYQDIVRRAANLFKSKKARLMAYRKPNNKVRYSILVISIMAAILGSSVLLLWLDPYSGFGRMALNLFSPVIIYLGNSLSYLVDTIPAHAYNTFTLSAIIAAAVFFIIITVLSALRGRLYCNLICPAGSLLGLISKYSLFKLQLKAENCTLCTLCSKVCKAQCIDTEKLQIDNSRCVQCFNCTASCKFNVISYKRSSKAAKPAQPASDVAGRRFFIGALGGIVAAGATRAIFPPLRSISENSKAISPPGSVNQSHFKAHCTSCHACIANCPSHVLRPAITEYGIDGFTMPVLDFKRSYCNYECTRCSEVCPNGAIHKISKEEKKVIQVGVARFRPGRCIVINREVGCGDCYRYCPTDAITMVDFRDGLKIPKVDSERCIGCGACEYICPVQPKAIFVVANAVHEVPPRTKIKRNKKLR